MACSIVLKLSYNARFLGAGCCRPRVERHPHHGSHQVQPTTTCLLTQRSCITTLLLTFVTCAVLAPRVETLVRERERVREKLEHLMALAALAANEGQANSRADEWAVHLRNVGAACILL